MILNKTTKPRDRYRVIPGSQGNLGEPANSPNHKYVIVAGTDRGNGWQDYISVSYFLGPELTYVPAEARRNLVKFLRAKGYGAWLAAHGFKAQKRATSRQ